MRRPALLNRSNKQTRKRAKIPFANEAVPTTMVTIRPADDFFIKAAGEHLVFFVRGAGGSITAVWDDRNLAVASMGSAKQRRAAFEKSMGATDKKIRAFATSRSGGRK